jgi:hypothetical protein
MSENMRIVTIITVIVIIQDDHVHLEVLHLIGQGEDHHVIRVVTIGLGTKEGANRGMDTDQEVEVGQGKEELGL